MKPRVLLGSAVMFVLTAACLDDDPLKDPGFDLWCGDSLCKWQTDVGSVKRVSTWHRTDYGVELTETPTVLSQSVDMGSAAACLRFKIIADVEAQAQVSLDFDFFDDGNVDHSESIPGVHWRSQELLVKLPESQVGDLRLALHKKGPGRAVFAELSADFVDTCYGDPILLEHLPNGRPCAEASNCENGFCVDSVCSSCETDEDCEPGLLCGRGSADAEFPSFPFSMCAAPTSAPNGSPCRRAEECHSGECPGFQSPLSGRACGECADTGDCPPGSICGLFETDTRRPFQACKQPGASADSASCLVSEECQSGKCCLGRCLASSNNCSF